MLKRVTLADIASRAGVHVTTVSLALRNHASLPLKTRQRLQALARSMGYRPDPMLSALMQYRAHFRERPASPQIVYLNPWNDRAAWSREHAYVSFVKGAQQRAEALGFSFEHCWLRAPGMSARRWNQIFHSRKVSGVILGPYSRGRGHLRLTWENHCWIKIDPYFVWPPVHAVANNQVQCAQLAVRQALKHGYRRIGLALRKKDNETVNRGWTAGYLAETATLSQKQRVPVCTPADWGPKAFFRWYDRHKPEVILSFHLRILEWLSARGIRVPKDVAFIDLDLAAADGKRAGIFEDHERAGSVAVEVLARLIQQNETGLPALPFVTQVNGIWSPGATLRPRWARTKR